MPLHHRALHRVAACLALALPLLVGGCGDDPSGGGASSGRAGVGDGGGLGQICAATEECPCDVDAQCESGICLQGPDGTRKCAKPCGDGCPENWVCQDLSTADKAIYVCVPRPAKDCVPSGIEVCDGRDNDCDGRTDETFCDDGNPCTDDLCDPELAVDGSQGCTAVNIDIPCDDGDLCTIGDLCAGGACQQGGAKDCDDFNDCTEDACDTATGGCTHAILEGSCSDGSKCTIGDVCAEGVCAPGAPPDCEDGNPCTDDTCDPASGCHNLNNTAPCEDGDLCTQGDACEDGKCKSAPPIDCGDDNECTKDFCDPTLVSDLSNGCTHTDVIDTCSDGDACTTGDHCIAGKCISGPAKNCDDGKPCTIDGCDGSGDCRNDVDPGNLGCTDGDACTTGDQCDHNGDCLGVKTDCDDHEACTVDACDSNTGKCVYESNSGASCEDGDKCTLGDSCQKGKCTGGLLKLCDDGLVCTSDSCDQKTGACVFANNTGACDDHNPCTLGDVCAGGECGGKPKDPASCSDGNTCTVDGCDPATGSCFNKNTADGVLCADSDKCTHGDSCQKGACTAGPAVYCSDQDPCTDDACNATTGTCEQTANTAKCDDGNKCTTGDACSGGKCVSGENACECTKDADCVAKEDGNPCNGTLLCEPGSHTCRVNTSTIAVCDKSKETECASFACSAASGVCEAIPKKDGIPCDADGSVCTNGDACAKGVCKPGKGVVCDDYDPCTDDSCDPDKGCVNKANQAVCFDGDHCTKGDVCAAGECKPGKLGPPCDDNDPCTADKCNPLTGNCRFAPLSGPGCSDGNECTTGDVCVSGGCQPTGTKPPCDDGNPCTIDLCNPKTGNCDAKPGFDGLGCQDGNQCTNGDYCLSGKCRAGTVMGCFQGGPCRIGTCNVATGKCAYQPTHEGGKCNDGNACSLEDICKAGKCVPKDSKLCDDKNPCTIDACNKLTGKCEYTPGTDGVACDDGNLCSSGDTCSKGKCVADHFTACDDNNICTKDRCNKATGKCVHAPTPLKPFKPCDDGNACTRNWWYWTQTGKWGDVCYKGKCHGHPISCNDGNQCTKDWCDPKKGCRHKYRGAVPCNDDNACTTGDNCASGRCRGKGKPCDDGNRCTYDYCHTKYGCRFKPLNSGSCNDNNACTVRSACRKGRCTGIQQLDCDDKLPCTDDSCHPKLGCQHTDDDTNACDDGDKCTAGDRCKAGKCLDGTGVTDCGDGNVCTTDTCDSEAGCAHADIGDKPCDDGNVCTHPDACKDGKCHSTGSNICDDANQCTIDSCHPKIGCRHTVFGGTCSDGDACTQGDHCKAGKCLINGPLSCDDGTSCTTDTCDKEHGCVHTPVKGTSQAQLAIGSDVQTRTYTKTKTFAGEQVPVDIEPAVLAQTSHGLWKPAIAGAKWIWRTRTPKDPTVDATVYFVREFAVPADATDVKATLKVAADDRFDCTLNGQQVAIGTVNQGLVSKDLSATLKSGDNILVCKVFNKGVAGATAKTNPAGLLFGLALQLKLPEVLCNDGNLCTALDVCELGQCVGSNGLNCNDGNGCTIDVCDPGSGCTHQQLDGNDCDDGDECTLGDTCKAGTCRSTQLNGCDDGNLCTEDACKAIGGCSNTPRKVGIQQEMTLLSSTSTLVSTDKKLGANGLPVPVNLKQAVVFTHPLATWTAVPGAKWIWHDAQLADPTKSETAYFQQDFKLPPKAETLRGRLRIAADNAFECYLNHKLVGVSPKNSDAFAKSSTLALTGALSDGGNRLICAIHNIGKVGDTAKTNAAGMAWRITLSWYKVGESPACDDGNACTRNDGCWLGHCLAGGPLSCDDDNACTNDACDVHNGCAHDAAANPCNDGSVCTEGDHCRDGECVGKAQLKCDDGNSCTTDLCHALSGCYGEASADGTACEDDSVCTAQTVCAAGVCKNGKPTACDDGNPCTTDTCFPLVGCTFKPIDGGACDDDDSCTIDDLCANGKCLGKSGNLCDDGNNCTADRCTKAGGCTHSPASGAPCNDGNLCTPGDTCHKGACTSGSIKACLDTEQCTADLCDAKTGKCSFEPMSDGECDDGNLCTLNDKCKAGKCIAGVAPPCGDGNTCTTDNCDPNSGKCQHDAVTVGTSCDDGNACTLTDRCRAAAVCDGQGKDCDDQNDCTTDTCNPANGVCNHAAVSDGTTCNLVGKCKSGACLIK